MGFLGLESVNSQLDVVLELVCQELQLTDTQYDNATRSYEAVGQWLDGPRSTVAEFSPRIFPQGSMLIGTTNKPHDKEEFDADLVCLLAIEPHEENPDSVYSAVLDRLRENGTYVSKVKPKDRCIRLEYAGQFHLDVIPACPSPRSGLPWGELALVIPDRNRRVWIPSNPKGYGEWFQARTLIGEKLIAASMQPLPPRTELAEKSILHRAVQLFKRRRDVHFDGDELAPSSILLTTIAGLQYRGEASLSAAICSILDYLVGWCRWGSDRQPPSIANPTDPTENLARHWRVDQRHFSAIVEYAVKFREGMHRLVAARGTDQIAANLDQMFDPTGSGIVKQAITAYAQRFQKEREGHRVGIDPQIGKLLAVGSAPRIQRIPPNTFFGATNER